MIRKTEAIKFVTQGLPRGSVLLRTRTIEKKWGWLFIWQAPQGGAESVPVIVNRADGALFRGSPGESAGDTIARYERGLLGGPVMGRVRMWLGASFDLDTPSFEGLRFPRNETEAHEVLKHWRGQHRTERNYRLADVEINGEWVLREVRFDRDTGIAVLVEDQPLHARLELFGANITRILELESDMKDRKVTEGQRNAFSSPHV
jgi:hypothetical protein